MSMLCVHTTTSCTLTHMLTSFALVIPLHMSENLANCQSTNLIGQQIAVGTSRFTGKERSKTPDYL